MTPSRRTPGRVVLTVAAVMACSRPASAPPAPAAPAPAAIRPAALAPLPAGFRPFEERLFTIAVPAGWERVRNDDSGRANVVRAENLVRFEDGRGLFFAVVFDPAGAGLSVDAAWELAPAGAGDALDIVREEPPCRPPTFASSEEAVNAESGDCPHGDGRLRIAAVVPELRGHRYVFLFGDEAHEERVDLRPFREILRTFRAR